MYFLRIDIVFSRLYFKLKVLSESGLQIRRSTEDNSKIIFLIFQ